LEYSIKKFTMLYLNMPDKKTQRVGSRAKVMHGGAEMTTGGLTKEHLMYNKAGRIVSKKKSHTMKQRVLNAGK
jgi:hypothetical protein